jgi:hypothetical protein
MKFPFGKKVETAPAPAPKIAAKPAVTAPKTSETLDGRKRIITGLIFIASSFLGAIFLFYLTVNAQSAKDSELRDMKQDLVLARTEKDLVSTKAQQLEMEVGRVIDLDKVVSASQKIHGADEATRKQGSMWINRKTQICMVTLGALNGVSKGSRLEVYDGEDKLATVKIVSSLDVVSYVEPIDKELKDFKKDYYAVKME